jgi:hypothetical protein
MGAMKIRPSLAYYDRPNFANLERILVRAHPCRAGESRHENRFPRGVLENCQCVTGIFQIK